MILVKFNIRLVIKILVFIFLITNRLFIYSKDSNFFIPDETKQVILGISPNVTSSYVDLYFYEKKLNKYNNVEWGLILEPWKGRIGRNGLAWGRGIHPNSYNKVIKKEGDGKSPAGVFELGGVWGYEKEIKKSPFLKYTKITSRDLWYEDYKSKFYNLHIRLNYDPKTKSEKKAQMRQNDYAHSLKMFIKHNAYPNIISKGGSSIFFHIWRRKGKASTSGCTTMKESNLRKIISIIDPNKFPLYVLLSRKDYEFYLNKWKLPK